MYLTEGIICNPFPNDDGRKYAIGRVYGHPTIPDGHNIRTSAIQKTYEEDGKKFIQTMNNVYELREEA
jgi:hypothetical protein